MQTTTTQTMKTSFSEILSQNNIVIPIIQRDYAQGRTDVKTSKIRKDFLSAIFDVLHVRAAEASTKGLELDFIYGFSKPSEGKTTFAPIDGQQRLTTLWLLLWYVSAREKIPATEKLLLSNFKYETRHSTTVFCEQLVQFQPSFNKNNITAEIKNQPWYFEAWDYDNSIKAMLVMLNDIESRYKELNSNNIWSILNHPSNPFYFYKLDMDKVGLPDDLYIKMNSRGKPLTEFEYFKAGFHEIIRNEELKKRFEVNIDQKWAECIWKIVREKTKEESTIDLAFLVDDCFLRLINFISDVLAYKQDLSFTEINYSIEDTQAIYNKEENLLFLFDVLDCLVDLQENKPSFWTDLFYISKDGFVPGKTRLFFQKSEINLLEKCLFNYTKTGTGFSYPEQILFYSCIIHLLKKTSDFPRAARIVRNLVSNSEYELRDKTIGLSFSEIDEFVLAFEFEKLDHFKTDQINEEKDKFNYIITHPDALPALWKLEDSDILRGCISIFDLDDRLAERTDMFLELFDEDLVHSDFIQRSNLLLCFGDYSQDDGDQTNMLAKARGVWRTFLTTPGYNKVQLYSKTKPILMDCLDFFLRNSSLTIEQKTAATLDDYSDLPKDWVYYFLKYPGFRNNCNKGYYHWDNTHHYPRYKMKEKQFNGYHWDPFLVELKELVNSPFLDLDNGDKIQVTIGNDLLQLCNHEKGFLFENKNDPSTNNLTLQHLITQGELSTDGLLEILQNSEKIDLEDRIEKGVAFLQKIVNIVN